MAGPALDALAGEPVFLARCRAARWLHVDHIGIRAVPALRAAGVTTPVSYDGGNHVPDVPLADVTLYAPTDAALAERYPGRSLADALVAALHEGPEVAVATRGSHGAIAAERVHGDIRIHRVPAPAGGPIVSTLGAGDVFHGALLAALSRAGRSTRRCAGRRPRRRRHAERSTAGRRSSSAPAWPSSLPGPRWRMVSPAHALAALRRPSGAFAMVALEFSESRSGRCSARRAARRATTKRSPRSRSLPSGVDAGGLGGAGGPRDRADAPTGRRGHRVRLRPDRRGRRADAGARWTRGRTRVDEATFDDSRAADADAFKLLVIWRPDRGAAERAAVVRRFLERCRERGRPGLVEGVVRRPVDAGDAWDHAAAVVACAEELGAFGPDIYKAEVPTLGAGTDEEITEASRRISDVLACPWVVLSNGTPRDRFDDAAVAACRGGASGFLAGRALWSGFLGLADPTAALEAVGRPRLRTLAARVDEVVGGIVGGCSVQAGV